MNFRFSKNISAFPGTRNLKASLPFTLILICMFSPLPRENSSRDVAKIIIIIRGPAENNFHYGASLLQLLFSLVPFFWKTLKLFPRRTKADRVNEEEFTSIQCSLE